MPDSVDIDDVKPELAMAVGFVALSDASVQEAAERAGINRWELEERLEAASLAEPLGVALDADLTEEIDRLLDEETF